MRFLFLSFLFVLSVSMHAQLRLHLPQPQDQFSSADPEAPDPRLKQQADPLGQFTFTLRDTLPDGKYHVYFDSTEKALYLKGQFVNQQKSGVWFFYYPNGQLNYKITFKNGLAQGPVTVFSYTGATLYTCAFVNGEKRGRTVLYDAHSFYTANRYQRIETTYSKDTIDERCYNTNGILVSHHTYKSNMSPLRSETFTDYGEVETYPSEYDTTHPEQHHMVSVNLSSSWCLPILRHLAEYTHLHSLTLYSYDSKGPMNVSPEALNTYLLALRDIPQLDEVNLTYQGEFPSALYSLPQVKRLSVHSSMMLSSAISGMTGLRSLQISGSCGWDGYREGDTLSKYAYVIPAALRLLPWLQELSINGVYLRSPEQELSVLTSLRHLQLLDLSNCGLHAFPEVITNMRGLRYLNFGSDYESTCVDSFTVLPESFRRMKQLEMVMLPEYFLYQNQHGLDSWRVKMPHCEFETYYSCFAAGTHVTMEDGSQKNIEVLCVGDRVISFNMQTQRLDTATVLATHIHLRSGESMQRLFSAGSSEPLEVTTNHPVMCGRKFMAAAVLQRNDPLRTLSADGTLQETPVVYSLRYSTPAMSVYNITTSTGTYFANGILVHNK